MVLTEAAARHLLLMIERVEEPKPEDACVRIATTHTGDLKLVLDRPTTADETFVHDGRVVLALDPTAASTCRHRTLDVDRDDEGGKTLILLETPRNAEE